MFVKNRIAPFLRFLKGRKNYPENKDCELVCRVSIAIRERFIINIIRKLNRLPAQVIVFNISAGRISQPDPETEGCDLPAF